MTYSSLFSAYHSMTLSEIELQSALMRSGLTTNIDKKLYNQIRQRPEIISWSIEKCNT